MTKDEFIEYHRHELGGWLLDAATAQRTGSELALSIRFAMKRIDARLSLMFDQLQPKAEANHKPATPPAQPTRK